MSGTYGNTAYVSVSTRSLLHAEEHKTIKTNVMVKMHFFILTSCWLRKIPKREFQILQVYLPAVYSASYLFVELVAAMSFRNVLEFASEQIAVLPEKIDIPVARICQNHMGTVFLCKFFRFLQ